MPTRLKEGESHRGAQRVSTRIETEGLPEGVVKRIGFTSERGSATFDLYKTGALTIATSGDDGPAEVDLDFALARRAFRTLQSSAKR